MRRFFALLLICLWGAALSQSAEDIAKGYVASFNAKDTAAVLSLYENPAAEQQAQFLLPYAFERFRIDPESLRVVDQSNNSAQVYFNYLPSRGHMIPGMLLLLNTGQGYYLSYSDLGSAIRQLSPFLAMRLDIQQQPELLMALGIIALMTLLAAFALLKWLKASARPALFNYESPKQFKASSENFALALGALYRTFWGLGVPLDNIVTPHQGLSNMLVRDWNIQQRDQLLETLMWLYHQGNREGFRQLAASYKEAQQDHLAWDMTQFITLCLSGASVGHLLPHEASNLLLHASSRLQKHYSSYLDYVKAFQTERFLWQRLTLQPLDLELEQHSQRQDRVFKHLFRHRQSPWRKTPWTTALEPFPDNDFFSRLTAIYFSSKMPVEEANTAILN